MLSKTILVSAFAALAYAQSSVLAFTRVPNPVTAGDATAITYATNDTANPVTILLRKGPSDNLVTIATLTDSAIGGQYIWTPSTSLENGVNYALQITQGTQFNYFGPFQIQGGGMSSGSSAPVYGSSSMTSTRSGNMSMTATSMRTMSTGAVVGGGNATMSRNSTMSGNSTATATGKATSTGSGSGSKTSTGAPYSGGSATGSGAGAASTGAASVVGSSIALVFGAAAVVLMG